MKNNFRERVKSFLIEEYDKLLAYSESYLKQRFFGAEAADIIQDVALNLFSRPDINAPIENISGYIYRSIRNRIIDLYRKTEIHESLDPLLSSIEESFDESDDENSWDGEVLSNELKSAWGTLSPDQQAILEATVYGGETFETLSRRWGIPVGTLLARKHRAVQQLKKQLT